MKKLVHINEYLIKKKINKVHNNYKYTPKTREELIDIIEDLLYVKKETNLNCIDTSAITKMDHLFSVKNTNFDISEWNVSNVTTMSNMFFGCRKFDCDLSNWDVSNVKNMEGMFSHCNSFTGKGLEKWNIFNVTNMCEMFKNCVNFDCDLSMWNVSKVTSMIMTFSGCENFKGKGLENWDVNNTIYASGMFQNCKNFDCDLSNWDVSNVTSMEAMFKGCKQFTGEGLKNWNVSKLNFMARIFDGCNKIKKIPDWFYKK